MNQILNEQEIINTSSPFRGIYFLVSGIDIVYVGQSDDVHYRISIHRRQRKKLFDSFSILPIPDGDMNDLEADFADFADMYPKNHTEGS